MCAVKPVRRIVVSERSLSTNVLLMSFLPYFSVVSYGRFLFALYLFLGVFPTVSNANKCAVFDAFKVLPENVTSFVGGAFALHATDCNELLSDSVQEVVALQWVLSHWNAAQKVATSQIGI
ncbi:ANF-receptor domain-containing protein [Aphelenchoides besseyi]|nr:ANF-receptor domain-containing protein [Aphelenchoides besseyi]